MVKILLKGGEIINMNTFNCTLMLENKKEWLEYANNIVKSNKDKNLEELLEDILTFDFKFDVISR